MTFIAMAFGVAVAAAATVEGRGPELEVVPARQVVGELPAPATWPALCHARPLRLLVVTGKGTFLSPYQRIAARMNAVMDVRYLNGCDAVYHVNDKWIEPNEPPSTADLEAYSKQVITETCRGLVGEPRYDAVLMDAATGLLSEPQIAAALVVYVKAGGVLAVMGNYYPAATNVLSAYWPAVATNRNSWMAGGSTQASGPELAGVPTERLTGQMWIPIAAPAHGGRALATGEAGAAFASQVGKGTILYCPTGPMSRRHDALSTIVREYDHDDIWLRYWDQLLHEVCGGLEAFPVYGESVRCSVFSDQSSLRDQGRSNTEYRTLNTEHAPGNLALSVRVVNRSFAGALAGSLHVVNPQGRVVYAADVPVAVTSGTSAVVRASVPVAANWGAGLYAVYVTLGDPVTRQQIHQALTYLQVAGTVRLGLAPAQSGWRCGETAELAAVVIDDSPWEGLLRFGVYDFRGRLLGAEDRAVRLPAGTNTVAFKWTVTDHGVRVDHYRAVVAAVKDGGEWGRADATFYKQDHWSMRNEYQWSSWSGLACMSPSTSLAAMRLLGHAGMNALGYPGRSGVSYPAERWGWRYYNEGIGMNTFSPLIEYENDAEIEAQLLTEAKGRASDPDLATAAFVLASVGEEAGFKNGWGVTYYWDTPVAPEKACRAFQWYLKTRYGGVGRLNETWRTQYKNWDEVKLTKEFSGRAPTLAADGWAHPKESPLGDGASGVSLAPYADTAGFYAWYYDRFIAVAKSIFRREINPVAATMSSAPASWIFASRECDVATTGPSCWNESQTHALAGTAEPSFGLVWGHFDWLAKDEDLFWGFLLQRTGHNDYWCDGLMFNGDMTHTRATMALRRWTTRLAGHEQAILDSVPAPADVGILGPSGLTTRQEPANMHSSLAVALMQAGIGAAPATPTNLSPWKVVFAVCRQALSKEEAERIHAYVAAGGTLVFTDRFANQDAFGAPQAVCPGHGLAERWGLVITNKVEAIPPYGASEQSTFALDSVAPELKGQVASGGNLWREQVKADGWSVLAAYTDGTPALMTRTLGKGRLVYLNAIYVSHHYIQFRTPTDAARQGFFRLIEWLCRQAGARPTLALAGDLQEVLHTAVKQFTDPTGRIRYVILKNSIEAPWIAGRAKWSGGGEGVYDVLSGQRLGTDVPFHFGPNEGRWLAVTEQPVERLDVSLGIGRLVAGEPMQVKVRVLDAQGRDIAGRFPLVMTAQAGDAPLPGLRRALSLASGGEFAVQTARSDPAGTWTITVKDGIAGVSGAARIRVSAAERAGGPGFVSDGWPSESGAAARLTSGEFLGRLHRLADIYQREMPGTNWLTKQTLGAFCDYFPGTRHALLRPLYDADWTQYVDAWRADLNGGGVFVLTGEDMGIDPGSGLGVYPHGDARQFAAVASVTRGADWRLATADGDTVVAVLGQGRLILCRESIDGAGYTNPDVAHWQARWLAELGRGSNNVAITAMHADDLRRWWSGEVPATRRPRTVTWFADNRREQKLTVDPARPLDSVFVLALPPSGRLAALQLEVSTEHGPVSLEVGCDAAPEARIAVASSNQWVQAGTAGDWPAAVAGYLAARDKEGGPIRDTSAWRQVPVRVTVATKTEVQLRHVRLTVEGE